MALKLWDQLEDWKKNCTWVDLTHEMSPQTPHWVGFSPMTEETFLELGNAIFQVHTYTTVGQYGTHVDVGSHMVKGGRTLESLGPESMILPLCVIDKTDAVAADPDYVMRVEDIETWEQRHGTIPAGAFVVFQSGWSKRAPDAFDNLDADGNRHFPGWSMESLKLLIEKRNIAGIGHETSDTEAPVTSGKTSYAVEYYLLEQDKFQVELLVNVDKCPSVGALVFCTFPKLKGASGFPARCFAVCPK